MNTSFFSDYEIEKMKFKSVGKNVLISKNAMFYYPENIIIGDNVRIDDFCILSGKIVLHSFIHIAAFCALYGGNEGIEIDDYSTISSRGSVYSVSDDYSGETMTNPMIPKKYKKVKSGKIYIGKNVIIGSTSVILPGVNIGEGAACGAFSLINRDLEPYTINVGIPCRKLKSRKKNFLLLEEQFES